MASTNVEAFDTALVSGLRRLKLRRVRQLVPEGCQTAATQRWRAEELLRAHRVPRLPATRSAHPNRNRIEAVCHRRSRSADFDSRIAR